MLITGAMIKHILLGALTATTLFAVRPSDGQAQTPMQNSAQDLAPNFDQFVKATVLPGWRTADGTHMAGLELQLAPGWKTYWRSPGDAGIPPSFDWQGSANIGAVKIHWPAPKVFVLNGLLTIAYKDRVVFPIEITPATDGQPIEIEARVDLGVCEDVCVPVSLDIQGLLSPDQTMADTEISTALNAQPTPGQGAVTCNVEDLKDGLKVTARIPLPPAGDTDVAVIEFSDPAVWVSEAETKRVGDNLIATSELIPEPAAPFALDASALRFTVFQKDGAFDFQGCQTPS